MLSNNFQGLINDLRNISFSTENLVVNSAKKCKEEICQVPKNIMHYMSSDKYKNGAYLATAGAMTMFVSTYMAVVSPAMGIDLNPYWIAVPFATGLALYFGGLKYLSGKGNE
jgi:hypothetical protein